MKSNYKIGFTVNEAGCWICGLPVNSAGYPTTKANGKITTAHRYVYETTFGEIPKGLIVRHKCDEKRCINPAHLELGSYQDNVTDRVERGRSAVGSKNGKAKLTEDQAKQIKGLLKCDFTISELSRNFGVDRRTIRDIRDGVTWLHV